MRRLRRVALEAAAATGALRVLERLLHPGAAILMLHRFAEHPEEPGFPVARLRELLAWLRRGGYHVMPLAELAQGLLDGRAPDQRSVAFTVDDGYADFARAQPIFAEFDCPVTVFLVSGFLDGTHWMWWDQLEYLGRAAEVEPLKRVPDAERLAAIARAADARGEPLPARAPARFAPMSWDDARGYERAGVSFGPHTVSHPILSRVDDEQSRREIGESWRRVCAELVNPVPVFCYPNGDPDSFGEREVRAVQDSGMQLAVTTSPGYARARAVRAGGAFRVPRFAFPRERADLAQIVSGIEHLKAARG